MTRNEGTHRDGRRQGPLCDCVIATYRKACVWRCLICTMDRFSPFAMAFYFIKLLDLYTECTYIQLMDYQWDPQKATTNRTKHGIDFADAVGVFEDPRALTLREQYISDEQRFVTLGMDFLGRHLVVAYTHRREAIRLISARRATRREQQNYERKRRI